MSGVDNLSRSNLAQQINDLFKRIMSIEDAEKEQCKHMGYALNNAQKHLILLENSINQAKVFQYNRKLGISAYLEETEEMFQSVTKRIREISNFHEIQHARISNALQQESENLKSLRQSLCFQNQHESTEGINYSLPTRNHQQNQNQPQPQPSSFLSALTLKCRGTKRAALTEALGEKSNLKMENVISFQQSKISILKENQDQQHKRIRSDLEKVKDDLHEVLHRVHQTETTQRQKPHDVRNVQIEDEDHDSPLSMSEEQDPKLLARSDLKTEDSLSSHQSLDPYVEKQDPNLLNARLKQMTVELQTLRSILKDKESELQSFKDRVALEVAPSIKTGNTMSLNSPVSKNRIREMYESLRCDWPMIKENLKANRNNSDEVKFIIQKQFTTAQTDMESKKMMISDVFNLENSDHGTASPKVKEYMQLTIQNLQLALRNQKYDNRSQKPLSAHTVKNPEEMLTYLASECYWLGCLMALNHPPIQPDWGNHPPSMDKWNILPRNIVSAAVKK